MEHSTSKECIVCYEMFNKTIFTPRILTRCGHSLCESCLKAICQSGRFKCPMCQCQYVTFENGIDTYPRNYALIGLMDEIKVEKEDLCVKHNSRYVFYDLVRLLFICPQCFLHEPCQTDHLITIQNFKDNLILRGNIFTEKYGFILKFIDSKQDDYYPGMLRNLYNKYKLKIAEVIKENEITIMSIEIFQTELNKTFCIFLTFFNMFNSSFVPRSKTLFAMLQTIVAFQDLAVCMEIGVSQIRKVVEDLEKMEKMESINLFEEMKVVRLFETVEKIMNDKLNDEFILRFIFSVSEIKTKMRSSRNIQEISLFESFLIFFEETHNLVKIKTDKIENYKSLFRFVISYQTSRDYSEVRFEYDLEKKNNFFETSKGFCILF